MAVRPFKGVAVRHIYMTFGAKGLQCPLTLTLLTWRIRWAPNNASRWQMGFNWAFKGLKCPLTLILLTWRIWWAPNNVSGWQMGFNWSFKGLKCPLTLILLTWRIWWAPNNASRWQMGFNWAFKGLDLKSLPSRSCSSVYPGCANQAVEIALSEITWRSVTTGSFSHSCVSLLHLSQLGNTDLP